ncbi:MAG: DUF192 domain-containing protein [Gammaproteobacteria bacterium]
METGYLDVCPGMMIQKTTTLFERARGLLGRSALSPQEGLWIQPCWSVHTFFMNFTIDVVFLDAAGAIKKIAHGLAPNRVAICFGAFTALELPSGIAGQLALEEGQTIQWLSSKIT